MDLQTVFYIVAIIFMGVMLVLLVALLTAVFVIRAKVNAIHRYVEQRLGMVTSLIDTGNDLVRRVTGKKDRR